MTNEETNGSIARRPATTVPGPPLTHQQKEFARVLGQLLADRWDRASHELRAATVTPGIAESQHGNLVPRAQPGE